MCLILFSYRQDPDFPLVVAANRDESYNRPSQTGHFWLDSPQVFGGRDLLAGGTWMGVTVSGRFAAVTNYREVAPPAGVAPDVAALLSRGDLVKSFLTTDIDAEEYLNNIKAHGERYAGFNLLAGDAKKMFCYSNREAVIAEITAGVHGLSNGALNEPWPKVADGKRELAQSIGSGASLDDLQNVLLDTQTGDPSLLPDTGIGFEAEEMLSSRFIQSENYGTRTTTVLRISRQNHIDWLEQSFDSEGPVGDKRQWRINDNS